MKILIIDDEENYTALLKLNLEFRLGHEVEMVNRSDEAVAAALRFRPDVILLDVVMPGMDGGDVLHQFETHPLLRRTAVIFVTALAGRGDEPTESAGRLMLAKPVSLATLERTMRMALERVPC